MIGRGQEGQIYGFLKSKVVILPTESFLEDQLLINYGMIKSHQCIYQLLLR